MNNTNTSFYRRSLVVVFLGKISLLGKQVLPIRLYDNLWWEHGHGWGGRGSGVGRQGLGSGP